MLTNNVLGLRLSLALAVSSPVLALAQVIPWDRRTDWAPTGSEAAFTPTASVFLTAFGADNTGVLPCDSALNAAISALGGSGEVIIPAGDYLFTQAIVLPDSIILQGEADAVLGTPLSRLLLSPGSGAHGIVIAGTEAPVPWVTSGGTGQGSSSVTASMTAGIQVGDLLRLIPSDDSTLVNDWWGIGQTGQIVKVMSIVNATTFTISRPIRRNMLLGGINKIAPRRQVHLRCLAIKRVDASPDQVANILLSSALDCSVTGVYGELCNYAHVNLFRSTRITVENCFFKDAHSYASGGNGYGVLVDFTSGECFIHRNTFEHLRHSMLVQAGANGNVFGYNHSTDPFWSAFPFPSNAAGDLVLHGNYPYMNLFEGNVVQNIVIDDSHGINGPNNMFFRNRAELYGIFMNNAPPSDRQTFIGNQVTDTTSALLGFYNLQGVDHFEYGNQIKGTVLPAGTTEPTDDTQFNYGLSSFYPNLPGWPPIRTDNWLATHPLNEAEYRKEVLGQPAYCGDDVVYVPSGISGGPGAGRAFELYPVPASERVILEGALSEGARLRALDALGRCEGEWRVAGGRTELDLSRLAPGVHFLQLPDPGRTVLRFVKE